MSKETLAMIESFTPTLEARLRALGEISLGNGLDD